MYYKGMSKYHKVFFLFLFIFIFSSCERDETNVPSSVSQLSDREKALALAEEQGFSLEEHQFEGNKLIVEGDIVLLVDVLAKYYDATVGERQKTRFHKWRLRDRYATNLRIDFSREVSLEWQKAFVAAAKTWNNVIGTRVQINIAMNGERHVTIRYTNVNKLGRTGFPVPDFFEWIFGCTGAPYHEIEIGKKGQVERNKTVQLNVAIHELGHVLGIHHSYANLREQQKDMNRRGGKHVHGTKNYDPKSIMLPYDTYNINLSHDDKYTIRKFYPGQKPKPSPPTKPIRIYGPSHVKAFSHQTFSINVKKGEYYKLIWAWKEREGVSIRPNEIKDWWTVGNESSVTFSILGKPFTVRCQILCWSPIGELGENDGEERPGRGGRRGTGRKYRIVTHTYLKNVDTYAPRKDKDFDELASNGKKDEGFAKTLLPNEE